MKYSAKSFGLMEHDELRLSCMALIIKIYAITGWSIPDSETLDILIEQLALKIEENYHNVNSNEVEFAFRNSNFNEYGKNFNLIAFDNVISDYLKMRYDASRLEEQQIEIEPMVIETSFDDKIAEVEEFITNYDSNLHKYFMIPSYIYDYMVEINYLNHTNKDKIVQYRKATLLRLDELRNEALSDPSHIKYYNKIKDTYDNGELLPDSEVNKIHSIYKKISVIDYIISKRNGKG